MAEYKVRVLGERGTREQLLSVTARQSPPLDTLTSVRIKMQFNLQRLAGRYGHQPDHV